MATSAWGRMVASVEKLSEFPTQDDSSESEAEPEPAKSFHRRISTNKDIKSSVSAAISRPKGVLTAAYLVLTAYTMTEFKLQFETSDVH
ncbi:hypothetical protein LSH36_365g05031 [Paralvinella palmiformis]|uniref:Uncharacterized protein n=1 Tax=Paralvinella palmiformis TaxID=53620 RepID=A0AAD9MZP8_9ANNE|nr:hypothetical protein LSH36_365g05031 [Paralvinella palmiformis]